MLLLISSTSPSLVLPVFLTSASSDEVPRWQSLWILLYKYFACTPTGEWCSVVSQLRIRFLECGLSSGFDRSYSIVSSFVCFTSELKCWSNFFFLFFWQEMCSLCVKTCGDFSLYIHSSVILPVYIWMCLFLFLRTLWAFESTDTSHSGTRRNSCLIIVQSLCVLLSQLEPISYLQILCMWFIIIVP